MGWIVGGLGWFMVAEGARVESIESIRSFRTAMLKFAESATVALDDAEADLSRTLSWLETEQRMHWQSQIRQRGEIVARAKEAVRQKKLFKDSTGRAQSAVDEEKALALALRRFEEAEQKLAAVKKWASRLQKEILNYKGQVQRLATSLQSDIPTAVARLDQISGILEQYVSLRPDAGGPSQEQIAALAAAIGEAPAGSMARPSDSADEGETRQGQDGDEAQGRAGESSADG